MGGFYVVSAVIAGAVALWLLRKRKTTSSSSLVRPRFKDFRHSGSTFEESQANYHAALREYNRRTGRDWED